MTKPASITQYVACEETMEELLLGCQLLQTGVLMATLEEIQHCQNYLRHRVAIKSLKALISSGYWLRMERLD